MTSSPDVIDDDSLDEKDDPRAQLWESIAEGLAALSESPDAPDGVTIVHSTFGTDHTRPSDDGGRHVPRR